MVKILVTGFEPFGGSNVNPSQRLVEALAVGGVEGVELVRVILPCRFEDAGRQVAAAIDRHRPDAVVCFGQGSGASMAVERVGVNLEDARIADNAGDQPDGRPVDADGAPAYFATLPVKELARALNAGGVPARLSLSAGAFVCNHVLYSALRHLDRRGRRTPCGFVHVPKLPEQVATDDFSDKESSMGLDTLTLGARIVLTVVADHVRTQAPVPALTATTGS